MVFGLSKKEHRVPDLSRYDYYYQNSQDYNRSARLSAAAASAATNGRSVSSQPLQNQQRSNSLLNTSEYHSARRVSNTTRHNSQIAKQTPSAGVRRVKNSQYKTYSLRSQSSAYQPTDNNGKRISTVGATPNNNIQKKKKTSRLNSMSSNNSKQLKSSNSRSNSITTQITKVKDPQGRTKSITKKTIKRIDGYEYIETTTKTTTIVPSNETGSLDSNQQHFNAFNEDFIVEGDFRPIQDIEEETELEDSENTPGIDNSVLQGSNQKAVESYDNNAESDGNDVVEYNGSNNAEDVPISDHEEMPGSYDYENPYSEQTTDFQNEPESINQKPFTSAESPKKSAHPYAQNIIPSENRSDSLFSDALEHVSNEETVKPKPKGTQLNKKTRKQKGKLSSSVSRKEPTATGTANKTKTGEVRQTPAKPLTEEEMYLKALEIARKKVYSNSEPVTKIKKETRTTMGQRLTLRKDGGMLDHSMAHNQNQPETTSPKKHKKKLSFFSFEKNHDAVEDNYNRVPLPSNINIPVNAKSSQSNENIESKITMSDADMYAMALEVAQRRYNESHYTQPAGIPITTSNTSVSVASNSSGRINSNAGTLPSENYDLIHRDDQYSEKAKQSTLPVEEVSNTVIPNDIPKVSSEQSKGSTKQTTQNDFNRNIVANNESKSNSVAHNVPSGTAGISGDSGIRNTLESNRYITTNIDNSITTTTSNKTKLQEHANVNKSNHLRKLSTNDSFKRKSKFKHFVDKVVQFSTENSGYQLSREEQTALEKQKMLAGEQYADQHKFFDAVPQTDKTVPITHGAATTLPVQEELATDQDIPVDSPTSLSSFQPKNPELEDIVGNNTNTTTTTNTSSIFSKNKRKGSDTPPQTVTHDNVTETQDTVLSGTAHVATKNSNSQDHSAGNTGSGKQPVNNILTSVTVVSGNDKNVTTSLKANHSGTQPPKNKKKGFFARLFRR